MVVMGTPLCGANTHTIGAKREGVTGLRARSERAWRRGAKALREQPPELGQQQQAQGRPLVQAELRAEDARVEADELAIGRLPGFLSRELLRGDDGLWVDLVHWRSKAEALAAAEAFGTMPEVAAFASMIDETQMTMLHLGHALSFGGR